MVRDALGIGIVPMHFFFDAARAGRPPNSFLAALPETVSLPVFFLAHRPQLSLLFSPKHD